jgi:hypothetical protein
MMKVRGGEGEDKKRGEIGLFISDKWDMQLKWVLT